jgi:hypothetical protein
MDDQAAFAFASVAKSEEIAYLLTHDLRLVATNAGWKNVAFANNGASIFMQWKVGTRIDEALPDPLRTFYVTAFERARAAGTLWQRDYEDTSLSSQKFRLLIYPLRDGTLLVVNAKIADRAPHETTSAGADYLDEGFITMCAHCRRVRRPSDRTRWDWVPVVAESMRSFVSHGLCPPCVEVYYPDDITRDP